MNKHLPDFFSPIQEHFFGTFCRLFAETHQQATVHTSSPLLYRSCHVPEWLPMGPSGPLESRQVSVSLWSYWAAAYGNETMEKEFCHWTGEKNIHLVWALLIISHNKQWEETNYVSRSVSATFHYFSKDLKSSFWAHGSCWWFNLSFVWME